MLIRAITAATSMPVSLEAAKAHSRLDDDDSDATLAGYLAAAHETVAAKTGRVLAPSTWRLELADWWRGDLEIPLAPVRDVVTVAYLDPDGDAIEVDASLWRWWRTPDGGRLRLTDGFALPSLAADRPDAVRVTVAAGYDLPAETGSGDDPELAFPERAGQAVLLLTAQWFENREAINVGNIVSRVPLAFDALVAGLRIYR